MPTKVETERIENVFVIYLPSPTISRAVSSAVRETIKQYNKDPSLHCAVITSRHPKYWSIGADLKEWATSDPNIKREEPEGLCGLSRRGKGKPILACVNGVCVGGGLELALGCDLIVAREGTSIGFPEVKRGVSISSGGLGRLVASIGWKRASQMCLVGDDVHTSTLREWGLINYTTKDDPLPFTIELAKKIGSYSSDAVIVTRNAILEEGLSYTELEKRTDEINNSRENRMMLTGENIKEGLKAFQEKRAPRWKDSKM